MDKLYFKGREYCVDNLDTLQTQINPGYASLGINSQSINAKFDEFEAFINKINVTNPISAIMFIKMLAKWKCWCKHV